MLENFDRFIFRFFVFWYICGVILLTFDILPPSLEWANTVFLVLTGVLGAIFLIKQYGKILGTVLSILIIIITFIVEGVGVHYGILFGDYFYNPDFGLILFEVPFTIGAKMVNGYLYNSCDCSCVYMENTKQMVGVALLYSTWLARHGLLWTLFSIRLLFKLKSIGSGLPEDFITIFLSRISLVGLF